MHLSHIGSIHLPGSQSVLCLVHVYLRSNQFALQFPPIQCQFLFLEKWNGTTCTSPAVLLWWVQGRLCSAWSLHCLKWMGTCRCCHVQLTKWIAKCSTSWTSSENADRLIECGPLIAKKVEAHCPLPTIEDWPLLSFCSRMYICGETFFVQTTIQFYLACLHCKKMQQFFSDACKHFIIGFVLSHLSFLFLHWTCFCCAVGNDDRLFCLTSLQHLWLFCLTSLQHLCSRFPWDLEKQQ